MSNRESELAQNDLELSSIESVLANKDKPKTFEEALEVIKLMGLNIELLNERVSLYSSLS